VGSYDTTRTFVRYDTGDWGDGTGYVSYLHHDARAWDFDGHQRDDQFNAKYVREDEHGKLTALPTGSPRSSPTKTPRLRQPADRGGSTYFPYTRPFLFPQPGRQACAP
jgi:iron complex outermembrane receptor protein